MTRCPPRGKDSRWRHEDIYREHSKNAMLKRTNVKGGPLTELCCLYTYDHARILAGLFVRRSPGDITISKACHLPSGVPPTPAGRRGVTLGSFWSSCLLREEFIHPEGVMYMAL